MWDFSSIRLHLEFMVDTVIFIDLSIIVPANPKIFLLAPTLWVCRKALINSHLIEFCPTVAFDNLSDSLLELLLHGANY